MASSNLISNVSSAGLSGWNGLPQEVTTVAKSKLICNWLLILVDLIILSPILLSFDIEQTYAIVIT